MSVQILKDDAADRVAEALGIDPHKIKSITVEFIKDRSVAEILADAVREEGIE